MLINFYSNALKFTRRGGSIEIICKQEDDFLKISVKDTGIGISQEDQAKLFKSFGFLDSSKKANTKGIGLGLHICKLMVEEFFGLVVVQSEKGVGSTFTFEFKLENSENEPESQQFIRRNTSINCDMLDEFE